MNKQIVTGNVENKRLLNVKEACEYTGLGQTTTRKLMQEIGAVRRFGKRLLYDKTIIDAYLDDMGGSADD